MWLRRDGRDEDTGGGGGRDDEKKKKKEVEERKRRNKRAVEQILEKLKDKSVWLSGGRERLSGVAAKNRTKEETMKEKNHKIKITNNEMEK